MILVLGASGFIGRAAYAHLKTFELPTVGTYCRHPVQGLEKFDVESDSFPELLARHPASHVVLAAAAWANYDDSRRHWDEAYRVNVARVLPLLDACFERGIVPVYLSTDAVFDGRTGNYKEDDPRNPSTAYGQMRCEVENHLFESGRPHVVIRMGKVFGLDLKDGTLLTRIIRDMQGQDLVDYATDQVFSPVFVDDAVSFIGRACRENLLGTWHLASMRAVTFHELATAVKKQFQFDVEIVPCEINSLGLLERRPLRLNLDIGKYKGLTGFREREPGDYLERIRL